MTNGKYPKKTDLGTLYFFSTLDFLASLVNTVADDFVQRPQLYSNLEDDIVDTLGRFFVQYGTEPDLLAPRQRNVIRMASFGKSGTKDENKPNSFPLLRDELLEACSRYAANVRQENRDLLIEEVETALVPFHDYLIGLQGSSASWGLARLFEVNESAYSVLRSDAVAVVFGLAEAPKAPWPREPDPIGNILIEEISEGNITRALFGHLQQVALNGQQAIRDVLASNNQVLDNGCNLRLIVAPDGNAKDEIIRKFESEFESKKEECAVLIVSAASNSEKWTIAGFSDAGEFRTVEAGHELSLELKKDPINENRIVKLATSSLGRTPNNLIQNCNRWHASLTKARCTGQAAGLPNLGRI